ncbi:hypothetical protein OH77DRAFT_1091447 [Trametes cingulata]|nr:hypothetical protein OH77DRAFT_1091447 [Trametes cingulata]
MQFTHSLVYALGALICASPTLSKHGKGGDDGDGDDDAAVSPTTTAPSTTATSGLASSSIPLPSSSSTPVPPIPSIQFLPPANVTECQSLNLRWQSTSVSAPITLMITNDRAVGPATGGLSDDVLISRTVATNVSASTSQYSWSPVDVLRGAYVAVAYDTSRTLGILAQSPPFFVLPGQDTSCLTAATGGATPTDPLLPSPTSSPTSTGSDAAESSAVSSSDSRQKMLSPGALGGTIAGVSVAVVLFVLACSFPQCWKSHIARRPRNSRPGGPYYLF